tara:strand:- start:2160 stop:2804 length:645 start_codon:yes stop_codon:yes gene_type:complete
MALVTIPLLGRARKSAGEMTFTKWKSLNVLKNKASNVSNPNTVNQQMRRSMFSALVETGRTFLPVFDLGFIAYRQQISQFNAFIRYNYGLLVQAGTAPSFTYDIDLMVTAKGPLTTTLISSVSGTNASANVVVTWPSSTQAPDQAATDYVRIIVYNKDTEAAGAEIGTIQRNAGTATIALSSPANTGDVINAYMFFSRSDNSMASDSQFLQATV